MCPSENAVHQTDCLDRIHCGVSGSVVCCQNEIVNIIPAENPESSIFCFALLAPNAVH